MYKLTHNNEIIRTSDGAIVPMIEASRDYRAYMLWLDGGNTPLPADDLPNPRIAEIRARLNEIDKESIRALRAKANGKDNQADRQKLVDLDNEATALRIELSGL